MTSNNSMDSILKYTWFIAYIAFCEKKKSHVENDSVYILAEVFTEDSLEDCLEC